MRFRRSRDAWTALATAALLLSPLFGPDLAAQESRAWQEQRWGLGFTVRTANIPFDTETKSVSTLIPLIMFEGKWVYLYETEGGIKFVEDDRWRVSAMGRLHFFDIPAEFQNEIQGDRMDWGLQVRYKPWLGGRLDGEILTDRDGHTSFNAAVGHRLYSGRFRADAFGTASYKTSHYNTTFWGLRQEDVDAGVDLGAGFNVYWHVISSLYLQGAFFGEFLSKAARDASLVEDDFHVRGFIGIGLSNDRLGGTEREIENRPYWRGAMTWGTPSSLSDHPFQTEPDTMNSRLATLFYGHPLTDRLFSLPIHVYLHSGLGFHVPSQYQGVSIEGVVSIKVMYTIPLPWRIRIGFAEGVSILSSVPALETERLTGKGFQPSEYLNYLNPSAEISLGDIINWKWLQDLWLGYEVHHRSAIFETAQQFGRIKGGSNYPGVTLTLHR